MCPQLQAQKQRVTNRFHITFLSHTYKIPTPNSSHHSRVLKDEIKLTCGHLILNCFCAFTSDVL